MKRLFAAIETHPDRMFLDQLRELKSRLRHDRIRWVEENNLHITLKFFGETDEEKIPGIAEALRAVAGRTGSFQFRLEGLGVFGSRYDPRVVWVGIRPYERLALLMKETSEVLSSAGFPPDRQNPVPHLTVGRIREVLDKSSFHKAIEENRRILSQEMIADSFFLFESVLRKEGPLYTRLERFPLGILPPPGEERGKG